MRIRTVVTSILVLAAASSSACSSTDSRNEMQKSEIGSASENAKVGVDARVQTIPFHQYDDAPVSPDADDPAIWVPDEDSKSAPFIIGTLKDTGLRVFDLEGKTLQTVLPPNHRELTAKDPPVDGVAFAPGTGACPGSASGETFGRFNNVDIQYGFELVDADGSTRKVDIAVASDRGCDRLRIYEIDPTRADGPLVDITADDAPRVFPQRANQPSPVQSPGEGGKTEENPVDDQNTAYGLALHRGKGDGARTVAFVTQEKRSTIAEMELVSAAGGKVTYRSVRELHFSAVFKIPSADGKGEVDWTPCREELEDDPQFEGLVVDHERGVLYAAEEVVGIWEIPIDEAASRSTTVDPRYLVEPVKGFGAPYWVAPNPKDPKEFVCTAPGTGPRPADAKEGAGNAAVGGKNLEADAEGLAIYYGEDGDGYLIASSQGDDTFHVYKRGSSKPLAKRHLGSFVVNGTGKTDGHDVVNVPVGKAFPKGLLVVQNGKAEGPASKDPINGFEYDGSTQFKLVGWEDVAGAFTKKLDVEPDEYDPRDPFDD